MTDAAIAEHVARMNTLRKRFAEFWDKHFEPYYRRRSRLLKAEAMIMEWHAFRAAHNAKISDEGPSLATETEKP